MTLFVVSVMRLDTLSRATTYSWMIVSALCRRGRHVLVGLLLGDAARTAPPMDRVITHELAILS